MNKKIVLRHIYKSGKLRQLLISSIILGVLVHYYMLYLVIGQFNIMMINLVNA